MNKEDPREEIEDHDKDHNLEEYVDENAMVDDAVHVVGDDESSTDDNLDIPEEVAQQDESKDEYESANEDDKPIVDPDEDPVEDRRPRMLRELDSDLGIGWESTGGHIISAMMVAE